MRYRFWISSWDLRDTLPSLAREWAAVGGYVLNIWPQIDGAEYRDYWFPAESLPAVRGDIRLCATGADEAEVNQAMIARNAR